MLIWWHFGIFQLNQFKAYLSVTNLKAYNADLF